jgi:hypothetical protein
MELFDIIAWRLFFVWCDCVIVVIPGGSWMELWDFTAWGVCVRCDGIIVVIPGGSWMELWDFTA